MHWENVFPWILRLLTGSDYDDIFWYFEIEYMKAPVFPILYRIIQNIRASKSFDWQIL